MLTIAQDLAPQNYIWGSGFFGDIADIRRHVYTSYYVQVEFRALIEPIVGPCARFLGNMVDEIENPRFHIGARRYEEIAAWLWQRACAIYPMQIAAWNREKDARFLRDCAQRVAALQERLALDRLQTPAGIRRAILTACLASLPEQIGVNSIEIGTEIDQALAKEGCAQGVHVPIDFSEALADDVFNKPCRLVVLAGDLAGADSDLLLYGQSLLNHWIGMLANGSHTDKSGGALKEAQRRRIKITFLANENVTPRNNNLLRLLNPTSNNFRQLLESPAFTRLRLYRDARLFELRSFRSAFPGTVLTDLGESASEALAQADFVIATGEPNQLTLNGLRKACFRIAPIRDFAHVFFTGIKLDLQSFKYPHLSILFAPADVLPAVGWEPDLPSRLTAKQFADLFRMLPPQDWQRLEQGSRSPANILNVAIRYKYASAFGIRGPSRCQRCNIAHNALVPFNGTYVRTSRVVNRYRRQVLHILHFPQRSAGRRLRLGLRFASSVSNHAGLPKNLLTFEDLFAAEPEALFGFNFLYFITRNLRDYFNRSNPHFTLGSSFFGQPIDMLKTRIAGRDVVHPPLYNKGAVGMRHDGTLIFGRIRTPAQGAVTLPVGSDGSTRRLQWDSVNPVTLDDRVALFTPMAAHCQELQGRAPHVGSETRRMFFVPDEPRRYNFVMINDRLLGVVRGSTEIPPFGTVLSVPEAFFDSKERFSLDSVSVVAGLGERRHAVDGQNRVVWQFELGPAWAGAEWIMGGALLMIENGQVAELHHEAIENEHSVYRIEGWDLHSSQRTQETAVETDLREARSTIGLTADGQFFFAAMEGRANNRQGYTHVETVDRLAAYFSARGTEIRYALDLDSASSVALAVAHSGHFYLLNQSARGSDSKLGDTRFFNHLAYIGSVNE